MAPSTPTSVNLARARWLLVLLLVVGVLGGLGCPRKAPVPPEPTKTPMLQLQRVAGREQLLYQTEASPAHGYGRGDLLGIFAKVAGRVDPVGYGHVTRVRGQKLEVLATFLPNEYRAAVLWMGPLPDDEHLGHRIGKVLDSPDTGRFHIDVGQADGVRVGDIYRVFDGVITDANFDTRTLQKRPVGLLQVVTADDGKVVSLAVLRQGSAPRGAWVELIDADIPGWKMVDDPQLVTVLVLHLVNENVPEEQNLQRQYWKKLYDVLLRKEVALGKKSVLRLAFAERNQGLIDGGQSAIVEIGREFGADIVLWGSVQCTSSEACVRPNVTFVDQERFGDQARAWTKRTRAKDDLVGLSDDVGGVDQSIRGLASWLAGLAYYEAQAYQDAAYYLEQIPLEADLQWEWLGAQGKLFRCYEVLGDWTKAEAAARLRIDHGVFIKQDWVEARGRVDLAENLYDRGLYDEALLQAELAKGLAKADGDMGSVAYAWGIIGNILYRRGALDEAMRIRREEQLPVYDELGYVLNAAITWGKISDILVVKGELDEALRIRKEKQLSVYERLGDIRSAATAWGRIGDILAVKGELDEALRIRKENQLPAYEKLGDIHNVAITWEKIAEILVVKGDLEEALRIQEEKALPVYEELGDVRSAANAWLRIGDILVIKGELGEALQIQKEKALPVYERLGDIRSTAATWLRIADILVARGELEEALRIQKEKAIPAYENLGDVRSLAVTWGKIGDILMVRGDLDDAMRIRKEKELLVYEKLGDVRSVAITWKKVGDILAKQGHLDETIEIYDTKALPVFEALGDRRSLVIDRANLAFHLIARNQQGDRRRAELLLRLALKDAVAMRLPEGDAIRRAMEREGFATQIQP